MPLATSANASTNEYWSITDVNGNDVPLNTYAYAVKSQGGHRKSPPPLRGENVKIPHVPGTRFVAKQPDSQTITLEMWVVGAGPDGTIYDPARFEYNWKQLVNLFYRPGSEFILTKRFKGIDTGGTIVTAVGLGQYNGGLELSMHGNMHAEFSVDILMADPFFYADPVTVTFGPLPSTNVSRTFTVAGDYITRAIDLTVVGPVSSPQFTVTTPNPDVWARYGTNVPDGTTVSIDVAAFSASANDGSGPTPTSGYMAHSGSYFWLELQPGSNTVQFSGASGTGTATLVYQPVYF